MRHRWLLLLAASLSGCAHRPASDLPFLPLLGPPPAGTEEVYLTGMLGGSLVVEHGCVRLHSASSRASRTVLWHQGTELGRGAQGYFLRNARSGRKYLFGESISIGGGSMADEWVQSTYPEVAQRCGPPYASGWLPE